MTIVVKYFWRESNQIQYNTVMTILILLLLLQLGEEVGEMGEALILWIRHCSEHFSKIMSFHVILTTQLLPSALYKGSVL